MAVKAVKNFGELPAIKIWAGTTGLLMVGGGVPKNIDRLLAPSSPECAIIAITAPVQPNIVAVTR